MKGVISVSALSYHLPTVLRSSGRRREVRDPYDGLRPWSAITHGVGVVLAVAGTTILFCLCLQRGTLPAFLPFAVYGASMICLYLASTLYHCVNTSVSGRLALRKYDHCSIYLLIAGSYTPICPVALRHSGGPLLLGLVWACAAAGIALTICHLAIPRWLTSGIYLFMGWLCIFAVVPIFRTLSAADFAWLLAGGLLYTVGGILYAIKWPGRNNPKFGCHEIFHVFILLGTVCQYFVIYHLAATL